MVNREDGRAADGKRQEVVNHRIAFHRREPLKAHLGHLGAVIDEDEGEYQSERNDADLEHEVQP